MRQYVAFLRAINVGGHIVKMDRLRTLFEELGFTNVATFIASGNIFFESSAKNMKTLENKIERHLAQALGYEAATFIRSVAEISAIAAYQPFSALELEATGSSLYVMFLSEALSEAASKKLTNFRTEVDDFHTHEREIYWLCRTRSSESLVNSALLAKTIGSPSTTRNITTIRRLAAKYSVG